MWKDEGEVEVGKVFGNQITKDLEAVQTLLRKQMKTIEDFGRKETCDLPYFLGK